MFSENEIENFINKAKKKDCQILMTEKDYYRVKHLNKSELKFLKMSLEIKNQDELIKKINEIYD